MGFLSGLFHSRDKPTNSTNGSAYRFLFGGSNSGKAVNERSAIQMTAVYACGRILSESIAGLPIHVYKYTDSGSKEKVIKHPLYRLIHDEPNPEMTSFVFRETLITHVMLIPARRQVENNARKQEEEKPKLRVTAYCRVSTDSDEQATSYEIQVELYTEYIQKNPDWEFAGIYADDGISGTNTKKREEFNHMIDDCKVFHLLMKMESIFDLRYRKAYSLVLHNQNSKRILLYSNLQHA